MPLDGADRHAGNVDHVVNVVGAAAVLGRAVHVVLIVTRADVAIDVPVAETVRVGVVRKQGKAATEAVLDGGQYPVVVGVAAVVGAEQATEVLAVLRSGEIEHSSLVCVSRR